MPDNNARLQELERKENRTPEEQREYETLVEQDVNERREK